MDSQALRIHGQFRCRLGSLLDQRRRVRAANDLMETQTCLAIISRRFQFLIRSTVQRHRHGFALWKLICLALPKPWFRTLQEFVPGQGMRAATQDLFFCEQAGAIGFKFAVDNRIKVGHMSPDGTIW